MSSNIQRLGDTLTDRMRKSASAAVPTTIELGVINGDLSLTTDSIKVPIPKGDYMVNLILTHQDYYSDVDKDYVACTRHVHRVPDVFRKLEAGDRVLVAWVGHQSVVLAIVVPS